MARGTGRGRGSRRSVVTAGPASTGAKGGIVETLLETIVLDNDSGASRTDPKVSFFRSFASGAVASGSKVDLKYAGTSLTEQQADERAYYSDGSLWHAQFSAKIPAGAIPADTTVSIDANVVSGTFNATPPTGIDITDLSAQDYKMRVKDTTDHWCKLNHLITGGFYREIYVGPACRMWHLWGVFRNGELIGDTDQGQLQGHFYARVWADGTIDVWPEFVNGRVANTTSISITECEFKNGAASIINYTTAFSLAGHNEAYLTDSTLRPHWSANNMDFHARVNPSALYANKMLSGLHSTATQRANLATPTANAYNPHTNRVGFYLEYLDAPGGSVWIGVIPAWTAQMLNSNHDATNVTAANRRVFRSNDRVNAAAQGVLQPNVVNHTTGHPPVLVNVDYTSSGLSAQQTSLGWGGGATITGSSFITGGSADSSHRPNYAFGQAITNGGPWWRDMLVTSAVDCMGFENPGVADYTRNPNINSVQYYGSTIVQSEQLRASAWTLRNFSDAHAVLADNHPCKAYMLKAINVGFDCAEAFLTSPYQTAEAAPLGLYFWNYSGYDWIAWSPWQGHHMVTVVSQIVRRGQEPTSRKFITETCQKMFAGFLNACPYHALNAYLAAWRTGVNPTTGSPIAQDWTNVYTGGVSDLTIKLISDTGNTSGTCPVSGMDPDPQSEARGYSSGINMARLSHNAIEMAHGAGLPGWTTALRDYVRAVETADPLTEVAWGTTQGQERLRQ